MKSRISIAALAWFLLAAASIQAEPADPPPQSLQVWGPKLERPKLVTKVIPEMDYVPEGRSSVVVNFWIDEEGVVRRVDHLAGPSALSKAALEAARRWRFEPAKVSGHPVCAVESFVVQFAVKPTKAAE